MGVWEKGDEELLLPVLLEFSDRELFVSQLGIDIIQLA